MIPKLTDDAVADLPLHHGRADLLEEIMRTPVLDDRPIRATRRRSWLVSAAAAAVVAVIAAGTWWVERPQPSPSGSTAPPAASLPGDAQYVVLDAPGWELTSTSGSVWSRSVIYDKGGDHLEIHWWPDTEYRGVVADRRRLHGTPTPGEPIDLLGLPARMWAYDARDHTVIREPQGGWAIEIRGEGMGKDAYLAVLAQLRLVDEAGFEAALPDDFATSGNRQQLVSDMVGGIQQYVDPLFPDGEEHVIESYAFDPYQLGADVASVVSCAWLAELDGARAAGDAAREQRATDVLATVRSWPVLEEMKDRGKYPAVLEGLAELAIAGPVPEWYGEALTCPPADTGQRGQRG